MAFYLIKYSGKVNIWHSNEAQCIPQQDVALGPLTGHLNHEKRKSILIHVH